jgi:hypothetical protein
MANYTQINNDQIRETVTTKKTCQWCGQNSKGKLYRYGTLSPMLRQDWDTHLFCSVGCFRTYHG